MILPLKGSTLAYLADLDLTQKTMQKAQSQVSSGLRVQQPSDDPAAIGGILQLQADIVRNQQTQSNLGAVKSEASTADSSLQSAIQAVENAISLAAQGASSTVGATERANLADQISGLQQTLVGISQTTVNGRYIFSGDQDGQPAYQLDLSQPTGVKQLLTAPATRQILDPNGVSISVAKTAQDIFDSPAGNVFGAINALRTALVNNDQAGITLAVNSLHAADDHLNSQASFYGEVENRVADATSLAQKFQIQQQSDLSQLRDADIPTAAVALSQAGIQLQATLSVEATVAQAKNLFNYLA
jgi:flagellar hook-associated protein 3 FlgL